MQRGIESEGTETMRKDKTTKQNRWKDEDR